MSQHAKRDPIGSSTRLVPIAAVFLALGFTTIVPGAGCGGSANGVGSLSGMGGAVGGPGGGVASGGPGGSAAAGGAGGGAVGGGSVIVAGSGGAPASGGSIAPGSGGTGGTDPALIHGTGGNGSFSWTGNAQSVSAAGYYQEATATVSNSFTLTIASEPQSSGASCVLIGQFASLPPAAGFYPMGTFTQPQADGTFIGRCSQTQPFAADDSSVIGQVAIADASPGLVEGSFTMHAARSIPGTGGSSGEIIYSGAFSVGCRNGVPTSDPSCGAHAAVPLTPGSPASSDALR